MTNALDFWGLGGVLQDELSQEDFFELMREIKAVRERVPYPRILICGGSQLSDRERYLRKRLISQGVPPTEAAWIVTLEGAA